MERESEIFFWGGKNVFFQTQIRSWETRLIRNESPYGKANGDGIPDVDRDDDDDGDDDGDDEKDDDDDDEDDECLRRMRTMALTISL